MSRLAIGRGERASVSGERGQAGCPEAFHHLDPAANERGVAQNGMGRSIERLRAEVRKCVLLCSNYHAEVEDGMLAISG